VIGVSERTVQKHLQRCFRKLGVHSRAEAVALAWSLTGDAVPG
jgi:DNA-binding CsgD family transcriptional regulator